MNPTVALLARYPVKSMLGETVEQIDVGAGGLVGDRAYAVVDRSDGKVASAKNPRKWGRLLECRPRFVEPPDGDRIPPVEIVLPGGETCRSDQPGVDSILSRFIGRDVALTSKAPEDRRFEEVWPDIEGLAPENFIESTSVGRDESGESVSEIALGMAAPPTTFFDLSLLHIMTTSTLAALAAVAPGCDFDWRRYRPNVLIDTGAPGFVENEWVGSQIRIGGIEARGTFPTMRCVMTTLAQDGLPQDRDTLRAVVAANRLEIAGLGVWACAGLYADLESGGRVAVGDPVVVPP